MPSAKAEKRQPPIFYVFGVTRSGIEPGPPAPRADALTTMLRGGGPAITGIKDMYGYETRQRSQPRLIE